MDECPPEMLEINWPYAGQGEPRVSQGEPRASEPASYQEGGACSSGRQTVGRERTRAVGVAVEAPPPFEGVGTLRVAEYGDSAEANLHMLGDVALTSLRVPKGKAPATAQRSVDS